MPGGWTSRSISRACFWNQMTFSSPSARRRGAAMAMPTRTYVYAAASEIAPLLRPGAVAVDKSTVLVGTGDEVERIIRETCPELEFSVASNPEFLREGAASDDFKRPDRLVIGVDDEHAEKVLQEIYRSLTRNESPLPVMSRRAAEKTKYAANAVRKGGCDVSDVARGGRQVLSSSS